LFEQVTLAAIQRTNTHLNRELIAHKQALTALVPRATELHSVTRSYLMNAEELCKNSEMLEYQLDRLEEGVKDMSRSVAGGRDRVRALRGAARRVGGVHGIDDDSESEEEGGLGADEKTGALLGIQNLANIKKYLGAWLGTTRSQS
jgi:hypothetical protein